MRGRKKITASDIPYHLVSNLLLPTATAIASRSVGANAQIARPRGRGDGRLDGTEIATRKTCRIPIVTACTLGTRMRHRITVAGSTVVGNRSLGALTGKRELGLESQ